MADKERIRFNREVDFVRFVSIIVIIGLTIAVWFHYATPKELPSKAAQIEAESSQTEQERDLRRLLSFYVEYLDEIDWMEFERNSVFIGFNSVPSDIDSILGAWALAGNREIDFGVHIIAFLREPKGTRPGDAPVLYTVTARYGRVKK